MNKEDKYFTLGGMLSLLAFGITATIFGLAFIFTGWMNAWGYFVFSTVPLIEALMIRVIWSK